MDVPQAARALGYVLDGVDAEAQWERAVGLLARMGAGERAMVWVQMMGSGCGSLVRMEQCRFVLDQALRDVHDRALAKPPTDAEPPYVESRGSSLYGASTGGSPNASFSTFGPGVRPVYDEPPSRPQSAPTARRVVHPVTRPPRRADETPEEYVRRLAGQEPVETIASTLRPARLPGETDDEYLERRLRMHDKPTIAKTRPQTAGVARRDAPDNSRPPSAMRPGETPIQYATRIQGGEPVVGSLTNLSKHSAPGWWNTSSRSRIFGRRPFEAPMHNESEEYTGRAGRINDSRARMN